MEEIMMFDSKLLGSQMDDTDCKICSYTALLLSIIFGIVFILALHNTIRYLICDRIKSKQMCQEQNMKPASQSPLVWFFYIQVILCTIDLAGMYVYIYQKPD